MAIFNAHIYREMRLVYEGIEADTHEAAASIARDKPTGDASEIDDCDGDTFYACVDVQGDEQYEQSRWVNFEPERLRMVAPKLLEALRISEGVVQWALDNGADSQATAATLRFISITIAEAESDGIAPQSTAPQLLASLIAVIDYAENEAYSLEKLKDSPEAEEEAAKAWNAVEAARAAIAEAEAACPQSGRTKPATAMYDTLSYVAEILSGFKPDFLRNVGLSCALEKCLAALHAAEAESRP